MVKVYGQPGCAPCVSTVNQLRAAGIDFEYIDIRNSEEGFKTIINLGFRQTPVVITDDDSWSGVDIKRMNRLTGRT